jgi:hypothetical protein
LSAIRPTSTPIHLWQSLDRAQVILRSRDLTRYPRAVSASLVSFVGSPAAALGAEPRLPNTRSQARRHALGPERVFVAQRRCIFDEWNGAIERDLQIQLGANSLPPSRSRSFGRISGRWTAPDPDWCPAHAQNSGSATSAAPRSSAAGVRTDRSAGAPSEREDNDAVWRRRGLADGTAHHYGRSSATASRSFSSVSYRGAALAIRSRETWPAPRLSTSSATPVGFGVTSLYQRLNQLLALVQMRSSVMSAPWPLLWMRPTSLIRKVHLSGD